MTVDVLEVVLQSEDGRWFWVPVSMAGTYRSAKMAVRLWHKDAGSSEIPRMAEIRVDRQIYMQQLLGSDGLWYEADAGEPYWKLEVWA